MVPVADLLVATQSPAVRLMLRALEHETHDQSTHGRKGRAVATVTKALKGKARAKPAAKDIGNGRPSHLSRGEAAALGERMLADKPWKDREKDALEFYAAQGYKDMNGLLRGVPSKMSPTGQKRVGRDIRAAVAGLRELPQPVTTTRISGFKSFGIAQPKDGDAADLRRAITELKALTGKRRQEPGFLSTSVDADIGRDWDTPPPVRMELSIPQGTPVAYMPLLSRTNPILQRESELLLPPGMVLEFDEVVTDPELIVRARVVVG